MKKMKIRPYQQDAIDAVLKSLETNDRCQVHMAPGSGKTFVAHQIRLQGGYQSTVFACPSIQLVFQSVQAWTRYSTGRIKCVAVCSGKMSVADKEALEHLGSLGVVVTTDAKVIAKLLPDHIVFTTYKSASRVASAVRKSSKVVDVLFGDEAHRTAGANTKRAAVVLDNKKFPANKRVFLTATPVISNDTEHYSMADETVYGPTAYTLSFRRAVDEKILADYNVVISVVNSKDLNGREDALGVIATVKAIKELGVKKGLTFHSKVKSAQTFKKVAVQTYRRLYGERIEAFHLNGSHTSDERSAILNRLADCTVPAFISNVKILGEGFDYNELDFISLVDAKSSVVDIIQNIGRVMRRNGKDKIGTIVVPVAVDDQGMLNASSHKTIFKVAAALKSYDTMLTANAAKGSKVDVKDVEAFVQRHVKVIPVIDNSAIKLAAKVKLETVKLFCTTNRTDLLAEAFIEFCNKHKRLPQGRKAEESVLANWMHRHHRGNTPEWALVESTYNEYRVKRSIDPDQYSDLVIEFYRQHGRFPRMKGAGEEERQLYSARTNPNVRPVIKAKMKALGLVTDRQLLAVERIVRFVKEHKRPPMSSPREVKLYRSFVKVRHHPVVQEAVEVYVVRQQSAAERSAQFVLENRRVPKGSESQYTMYRRSKNAPEVKDALRQIGIKLAK